MCPGATDRHNHSQPKLWHPDGWDRKNLIFSWNTTWWRRGDREKGQERLPGWKDHRLCTKKSNSVKTHVTPAELWVWNTQQSAAARVCCPLESNLLVRAATGIVRDRWLTLSRKKLQSKGGGRAVSRTQSGITRTQEELRDLKSLNSRAGEVLLWDRMRHRDVGSAPRSGQLQVLLICVSNPEPDLWTNNKCKNFHWF